MVDKSAKELRKYVDDSQKMQWKDMTSKLSEHKRELHDQLKREPYDQLRRDLKTELKR